MRTINRFELIKKICSEHDITAYQIGRDTTLSTFAVSRILKGETENPSPNTLKIIIEYLENQVLGTRTNNEHPVPGGRDMDMADVIGDKVADKLDERLARIELAIGKMILDVDDLQEFIKESFKQRS